VPEGGYRLFSWNEPGVIVGGMGNTARLPGVHPHWLYFLSVADLDQTVGKVRAHGGTAADPFTLPNGMRLSACEDPQGAAFGLAQVASSSHPSS
jgi:predicted enzyme related to lactoylglutathione lyase